MSRAIIHYILFGLNEADSCLGFGKLFNVLQSPIGRVASQPMRNIETFPSKHMYLYLSLVKRKVAESYHNMDRGRYLVWLKWIIAIWRELLVSLPITSNKVRALQIVES